MRGGTRPTKPRDVLEYFSQRHVLAAQDVALARPPAMKCQEVAGGNVIDMDDVEPRIHVRGHAAGRGIEHDLTRRRGLHVAGAHRRRGVDDDHREPCIVPPRAPPAPRDTSSACNDRSSPRARPESAHRRRSRRRVCPWWRRCWCRRSFRPPLAAPRAAHCGCLRRWCDTAAAARARPGGSRPRRETTRSQPTDARSSDDRSVRSPTATSRAGSCKLLRSELPRTSTRTCQPSRSSALATAAPTKPDAPVTSARMLGRPRGAPFEGASAGGANEPVSATAARERVATR